MRRVLGAVLVALVVAGCSGDGEARSYEIAEVTVDARVTPDGALRVVEQRTFDFDGTYRFAFYELPLDDDEDVSEVSVAEDGVPLEEGDPDDEQPGTWGLEEEDDALALRWWFTEPVTDASRTFEIAYTVAGAATRHEDAAELYWQWIGTGWDVPTRRMTALVALPGERELTAGDDLLFWAHGPLNGAVEQSGPRSVRMEVTDVPPETFVELRALWPAEDLPAADSDGRTVREEILAEEACLATAANADRQRAEGIEPTEDCDPRAGARATADTVLLVLTALAALAGVWLLATHGRRPGAGRPVAPPSWTPPSDDPPALVQWLVRRGQLSQDALTATVMDLARRGAIAMEPDPEGDRRRESVAFTLRDRGVARTAYERLVMTMLFDLAGGGGRVTSRELRDWGGDHGGEATSWWTDFTSAVKEEGEARRWLEPAWPFGVALAVGLLLAVAAVVCAVIGASVWVYVTAFVVAALLLATSPLLLRRSPEGEALARAWREYGEFLKDGGGAPLDPGAGAPPLDPALVYAVALGAQRGLSRRLDRAYGTQLQGAGNPGVFPVWYYPIIAGHGSSGAGFSAVSSAVGSGGVMSGASGAGGGFSAGGGAGGGGSGGGAG